MATTVAGTTQLLPSHLRLSAEVLAPLACAMGIAVACAAWVHPWEHPLGLLAVATAGGCYLALAAMGRALPDSSDWENAVADTVAVFTVAVLVTALGQSLMAEVAPAAFGTYGTLAWTFFVSTSLAVAARLLAVVRRQRVQEDRRGFLPEGSADFPAPGDPRHPLTEAEFLTLLDRRFLWLGVAGSASLACASLLVRGVVVQVTGHSPAGLLGATVGAAALVVCAVVLGLAARAWARELTIYLERLVARRRHAVRAAEDEPHLAARFDLANHPCGLCGEPRAALVCGACGAVQWAALRHPHNELPWAWPWAVALTRTGGPLVGGLLLAALLLGGVVVLGVERAEAAAQARTHADLTARAATVAGPAHELAGALAELSLTCGAERAGRCGDLYGRVTATSQAVAAAWPVVHAHLVEGCGAGRVDADVCASLATDATREHLVEATEAWLRAVGASPRRVSAERLLTGQALHGLALKAGCTATTLDGSPPCAPLAPSAPWVCAVDPRLGEGRCP